VDRGTLLALLSHPDDEVLCAGTLLAQREAGYRTVVVWLTRGEMTEAFGPLPPEDVAERRVALGHRAGELLGAETRFLDFPDTGLEPTREAAGQVAGVIAEIGPSAVISWGDSWTRGMRHPDHQATAKIVRDALTLVRIRKVVEPREPHREFTPLFTIRDKFSRLPVAAVDVQPHARRLFEIARHYHDALGFGERGWLEHRLRTAGSRHGVSMAEEFEAWETEPGVFDALLPPPAPTPEIHPDRDGSGPVGEVPE